MKILLPVIFLLLTVLNSLPAQNVDEVGELGLSIGSGARALGMGGAFTAVADDATASSWNPAGLCVLARPEVSIVALPYNNYRADGSAYNLTIFGNNEHLDRFTSRSASRFSNRSLNFASLTYPTKVGRLRWVPQISYQRVIELGFDQKQLIPYLSIIDDGNSHLTDDLRISSSATGGLDVWSIATGIQISQRIYVGAAINRWKGAHNVQANITDLNGECTTSGCRQQMQSSREEQNRELNGTSVLFGILLKPSPRIRVGAVLKPSFRVDYTEVTTREGLFSLQDFAATIQVTRQGEVHWPRNISFGIAYEPISTITLATDFSHSNWSSARFSYDQERLELPAGTRTVEKGFTSQWPSTPSNTVPRFFNNPQQNTFQLRFGGEYLLIKKYAFPIRTGFFIDQQYYSDAAQKPVRFLGWSLGTGLVLSDVSVDFAYVRETGDFLYCNEQNIPVPGNVRYSCVAEAKDTVRSNRIYLSTIYRF